MVSIDTFRKLALSFPEATEEPHFEKTSFRVKKKIFATYDDKNIKSLHNTFGNSPRRFFIFNQNNCLSR